MMEYDEEYIKGLESIADDHAFCDDAKTFKDDTIEELKWRLDQVKKLAAEADSEDVRYQQFTGQTIAGKLQWVLRRSMPIEERRWMKR